ncbi:MAG: glycogen/starch/alpha-glucan phosphorylase [Elusimicrobiota bacterium]
MSHKPKVVEVAMEISFPRALLEKIGINASPQKAREAAMSTSVGGIGPLLRERIAEQSTQDIDVIGVTLLYESVWIQTWHEWGQINLNKKKIGETLRQFLTPTDISFDLEIFDGTTIKVTAWKLLYEKSEVYFLSAPSITDVVYPGPKDAPADSENPGLWAHLQRLKHSWVVGRGALELSKQLNRRVDIITLSETPSLFAHHKIVKDIYQNDPFFNETKYIFNDHTPLEYAHPIWDVETLETIKMDPAIYHSSQGWNAAKKTLDITSLLVGVCEGVYGVAKKHEVVMKAMPSLKIYENKIKSITNGVRVDDWQNPKLKNHQDLSDTELLNIKTEAKKVFLDFLWRHCKLWPQWAERSLNKKFILWTRRITPYKRLDALIRLLKNPDMRERFSLLNVVIVVGGRIHQEDNKAQDMVYELVDVLEKNIKIQEQVILLDNFNVWEGNKLFMGTDAAIMLADDTREASATGFMKAQMNGAVILATSDGAIPEFVHFQGQSHNPNGFFIPYINGEPQPEGLLNALESFESAFNDPDQRIKMIRAALLETPNVSVTRTVHEMKSFYNNILK